MVVSPVAALRRAPWVVIVGIGGLVAGCGGQVAGDGEEAAPVPMAAARATGSAHQAPPPGGARRRCVPPAVLAVAGVGSGVEEIAGRTSATFPNATGAEAFLATQPVDLDNPFFHALGTNGRGCVTCHRPSEAWSITPAGARLRFQATQGTDPLFRPVDGAVSPRADVSTPEKRAQAYAMLLDKGLIRIGLPIPAGAEFTLEAVDDPYGYASAQELSLFRRPLPAANLRFLTAVMWDGRETFPGQPLTSDLAHQANDATQGHGERPDPIPPEVADALVGFETTLFAAQALDWGAGPLDARGALGGPALLPDLPFFVGINDPITPPGAFDPTAMTLYTAWAGAAGGARAAIARGEALFDGRSFDVSGVRGLNDTLGVPVLRATCTTCHDTPQVGNHSVPLPLDLGLTDASRRTPDLPLYTLRNLATGERVQTTDPGRALVTGRWADVGKFKGPILRALAARAPYFHNGAAASLRDVVAFYENRFGLVLTPAEEDDLVAFLGAL